MRFFNSTKKTEVVGNLKIAEKFFERLKGLMFKKEIGDDYGLLIKQCDSIHMFFMKFPIDAIFLKTVFAGNNRNIYKVVKIIENIKPWRVSPVVNEADSVLEVKSGKSKNNISVNDKLEELEGI